MQVSKLSDMGGVLVEGVDLAAPRSYSLESELAALYREYGLVVFRGQNLTKDQFLNAQALFGGVMAKPPAQKVNPEHPGLFIISTRGEDGKTIPKDPEAVVGYADWHTDNGYVDVPVRARSLYCEKRPEEGGATGFIDGQKTYDALSDEMKAKIAGLHVIQSWSRGEYAVKTARDYRADGHKILASNLYPPVVYPVVVPHPYTGKKAILVPEMWSESILEMPGEEGDALLKELQQHATQKKFQIWHRYEERDMVVWDNYRFLHAAEGALGKYVRTMWAVSLNPGPQVGRPLSEVQEREPQVA